MGRGHMENLQNFKFPDFSEFSVPKEVIYPLLLKASSLHFWNFIGNLFFSPIPTVTFTTTTKGQHNPLSRSSHCHFRLLVLDLELTWIKLEHDPVQDVLGLVR